MQLTEEQILALAPDESSKKAGKDLGISNKWSSIGINENVLWGECQGSGSKPYQTQADIINTAFKCSCPSRKFPCKHGLGLLLYFSKSRDSFPYQDPPAWVKDWINKRNEKAVPKIKTEKPVDEAAQTRRREAREQSVEEGMEELLLWMKDIVRNGILLIPEKGMPFFSGMAKRLVDAKAPALSGMVRNLGSMNFYEEGWQSKFMDQLARIYLVIAGYKNKDRLPALLLEDIRSNIGFVQSIEGLKQQDGITDNWLVLAKQITEEDNLVTERNWLYGSGSNRYALFLQFIIRGQATEFSLTPGMLLQAELVFYPSAQPLRAIIKHHKEPQEKKEIIPFENWGQIAEAETTLNASLPFRSERPFIIQNITPVQFNNSWWLADQESNLAQLKNNKTLYTLLALSGGEPLNMAVIGKENIFEPIGVWDNDRYLMIG